MCGVSGVHLVVTAHRIGNYRDSKSLKRPDKGRNKRPNLQERRRYPISVYSKLSMQLLSCLLCSIATISLVSDITRMPLFRERRLRSHSLFNIFQKLINIFSKLGQIINYRPQFFQCSFWSHGSSLTSLRKIENRNFYLFNWLKFVFRKFQ